jgi:hypothetical protein
VRSAERLAEWRALVERIRQGDRSEVVTWDEVAAELGLTEPVRRGRQPVPSTP